MYHAVVIAVSLTGVRTGFALENRILMQISASVLLLHLLTFRIIPVARLIAEALVPEAVCFGCGTVIELVGIYKCGCGFIPHKERHVFSPCPHCGKYFEWVVCPSCETSIPI